MRPTRRPTFSSIIINKSSLRRQRVNLLGLAVAWSSGFVCEWVDRAKNLKMASTEGLMPITRAFLASYYDKYPFSPLSDDVSRLSSDIAYLIQLLTVQSPPSQGFRSDSITNFELVNFLLSNSLIKCYGSFSRGNFPDWRSKPSAPSQNWWEYVEK